MHVLTSNAGLAACLSVMATIATDRLTRMAYANVSPKNNKNACKCRTPNKLVAMRGTERKTNTNKSINSKKKKTNRNGPKLKFQLI